MLDYELLYTKDNKIVHENRPILVQMSNIYLSDIM